MRSKVAILNQAELCHELVGRLHHDIKRDVDKESHYYRGMYHATQKTADIKRLRRELLLLQKLVEGEDDV